MPFKGLEIFVTNFVISFSECIRQSFSYIYSFNLGCLRHMLHIVKSLDDLVYTFQVSSKNIVVANGCNPTLGLKNVIRIF